MATPSSPSTQMEKLAQELANFRLERQTEILIKKLGKNK
jgi:hypothetical protein